MLIILSYKNIAINILINPYDIVITTIPIAAYLIASFAVPVSSEPNADTTYKYPA